MALRDSTVQRFVSLMSGTPTKLDPFVIASLMLSLDASDFQQHILAEAVDAWARAYVAKFPVKEC